MCGNKQDYRNWGFRRWKREGGGKRSLKRKSVFFSRNCDRHINRSSKKVVGPEEKARQPFCLKPDKSRKIDHKKANLFKGGIRDTTR